MPTGARRTQSMPSRYFMPSESMGEYENGGSGGQRRRSAPAKPANAGGGLYPLDEEGTYGVPPRPPAQPAPAPALAPKRERKPKVYSSYSLDSKCNLHAKQLAKVEEQRAREIEEQRARRRKSSSLSLNGRRRTISASPSRSSKSPEPSSGSESRKKSSSASASCPEHGGRKLTPRTRSSVSGSSARFSTSSSSKFREIRESSLEDSDEYTYKENRKNSGYGKYADGNGLANGMGGLSLDGLRKPKIDSWDSMGILGLSSKMWNDTSRQQETFMQSTGHFLREDYNSYIM